MYYVNWEYDCGEYHAWIDAGGMIWNGYGATRDEAIESVVACLVDASR